MAELLVELFSEEIPARMQARAADEMKRLVTDALKAANLSFDSAAAYATPRRLALVVDGLPTQQPDVTEEKKGPKYGAPAKAIQGFMKANGIKSLDTGAELRETDKGAFYFVVRKVAGRSTAEVLPEILTSAIWDLPWPKSMRWGGDNRLTWVRPLHDVLAIFDGKGLSFPLQRGIGKAAIGVDLTVGASEAAHGIVSTTKTRGHRFLAPGDFEVDSFADYRDRLRKAKVMLDPAERRAVIAQQAADLAQAAGLKVKDDPGLLDEVTGLVEWPQVLIGRIEDGFMDLPAEVLSTSMRSHQKYFSTENADGSLADRFLVVANMEAPEGSERARTIVAGNERVLRARLADARFFWDHDREQPLSERVPALKDIVFHAKLGTVADKVARMESLAVAIAEHVPGAERDEVRSAALLAKADLTTGMVGEFPELQGIMGRYYALNDGEAPEVAEAVAEHYQPLGPNDRCPAAPVSVCVALADKIDTLVGFWAIDEKPTGSKDPYALRRAALGVIRLIVENKLRLPLTPVFAAAQAEHAGLSAAPVADDLMDFFAERLKVVLRDQGVRHDLITAVMARGSEDDLVRLLARVEALSSFLDSDDGSNLLTAYRRAANIVRIEEKKDARSYCGAVQSEILAQPEEKTLFSHLSDATKGAQSALNEEDFAGAMAAMARLRQPVDAFFDEVTVNAEDAALRENRLQLLNAIGATLAEVADFSKIEG